MLKTQCWNRHRKNNRLTRITYPQVRLRRKLKPETYLLQEENGNLFMNTGFRIDVSYNEATDVLTFSPGGDYVRVKPQPGHPTEE